MQLDFREAEGGAFSLTWSAARQEHRLYKECFSKKRPVQLGEVPGGVRKHGTTTAIGVTT